MLHLTKEHLGPELLVGAGKWVSLKVTKKKWERTKICFFASLVWEAMASTSSTDAPTQPLLETVQYLQKHGAGSLQSEFCLSSKQHSTVPSLWLFKYHQTKSDFSVRDELPFYVSLASFRCRSLLNPSHQRPKIWNSSLNRCFWSSKPTSANTLRR